MQTRITILKIHKATVKQGQQYLWERVNNGKKQTAFHRFVPR